jgi:hypothetical protein
MSGKAVATVVVAIIWLLIVAAIWKLSKIRRPTAPQKLLLNTLIGWATLGFGTLLSMISTGYA